MYLRRLLIPGFLILGLTVVIPQVKADNVGIFTYQSGTFTTINNTELDTPIGIDGAGDLLLATDGNIGGPVLLSGGTFMPISVPGAPVGAFIAGYALSQDGTIFGSYTWNTRNFFTDLDGTFTIISLPGSPRTTGNALINDEGQIIASSFYCCNQPDFVYDISTGVATPISFPGATDTSLIAINNNGQLLGVGSGGSAGTVYFVDTAGTFVPLTLPAGCAPDGINDSDEIVGNCFNGGVLQGFLDNSGTFTSIDYNGNSNVNDTLISDINDSGEIVGTYSDVPEPDTWALLLCGILALNLLTGVKHFRKPSGP